MHVDRGMLNDLLRFIAVIVTLNVFLNTEIIAGNIGEVHIQHLCTYSIFECTIFIYER